MRSLCHVVEKHFRNFYNEVYTSFSPSDEPNSTINDAELGKILGVIHSIETRYYDDPFKMVGGIIVHSALGHILINGNKRLSLIIGYFCSHYLGISMHLLEANFAPLIKQVVIEYDKTENSSNKSAIRLGSIKAFASEIREYSEPTKPQVKIDRSHIVNYLVSTQEKKGA